MTKDDILKEIYDIFCQVSIIPPKPYEKFYEEHKDDDEKNLLQILRVGRTLIEKASKQNER